MSQSVKLEPAAVDRDRWPRDLEGGLEELLALGYLPMWLPYRFEGKKGLYCGPASDIHTEWVDACRYVDMRLFPTFPAELAARMHTRAAGIGGTLSYCNEHVHVYKERMLWATVPLFLSVWDYFFKFTREFRSAEISMPGVHTKQGTYSFIFNFNELYWCWDEASKTREEDLQVAETLLLLQQRMTLPGVPKNEVLRRACLGWLNHR